MYNKTSSLGVKIITILLIAILSFSSAFAYTQSEGSQIIEIVKEELTGTKYSFKNNEGSSGKSSYHIFYDGKMVGYIYSTKNGISMGQGWEENGELGTFFNKKDFTKNDILKNFYKQKVIITDIKKNNFKILNKKISYNKDEKNIRMYFDVEVLKKGDFILDFSLKNKFPNGGSMELKKEYNLLNINNKIYFGTTLYGDKGNTFIDGYKIKIYECTGGLEGKNCKGKNEIYSEEKNNLNISTGKNYNFTKKVINKSDILFKKYFNSREKIKNNKKISKYLKGFDFIIPSLSFKKLLEINKKVKKIKEKNRNKKGEKYLLMKDLLDFIENYINYYIETHEEGKIVKKYDLIKVKHLVKTTDGRNLSIGYTSSAALPEFVGMKLGESKTIKIKGKESGGKAINYDYVYVTKTITYIIREK